MLRMWTDDPVADAERYFAEQDREIEKLPVCADCGEHIQADHYYLINDEPICPDCLDAGYRKDTDDFFE